MSRRRFCAAGAAAAACAGCEGAMGLGRKAVHSKGYDLVLAADRERILREARHWLGEKPETITSFVSPRSTGGPHDYFSESDYFWPNPANPDGPYKEIDGRSNPSNFVQHRAVLIRFSRAVSTLAAALKVTQNKEFARAAVPHVLAWFVTPETRMNPDLEHSQGVRQGVTGRSYGIIDTLQIIDVPRAILGLRSFFKTEEYVAVQQWFSDYLTWLNGPMGMKERDATNNHSIAYSLQVAEFARVTENEEARDEARKRFEEVQLPMQMAANGSFPRELARTKPYGYSIFQFDLCAALSWSIYGEKTGSDGVWEGVKVCRAAEFIFPYIADKTKWPYPPDVQHWDGWPVRSQGLLFCGLGCGRPEYLDLWKRLEPESADEEVARNTPLRQPILWV